MVVTGMGEYSSDSQDIREGAFRFGKIISYDHLKKHFYRSDTMYFLCRGLIEESIGKGFEVVDSDEQALDWNDDFQEVLSNYMPELVRALSIERRDGRVLTAFMKNNAELYFRSFSHEFYRAAYDEYGKIERVTAKTSILGYNYGIVTHEFAAETLEGIKELIYRRREKLNSGMSYMEPIWDIDIALYFVASHIAYHVARHGSGIKAFKEVEDDSNPVDPMDDDTIDDLIEKAANFGGASDILWIPRGVELLDNLLTSGTQVKWMEIFDILLSRVSIYSGVPMSRLKGLVPGQLEGAEVNEESYFDVLRDIQEQVKPFIKWFTRKIAEFYGWIEIGEADFDILFNVREEMSESDTITLDMKRLDLAKKYIDLGLKRMIAFEKAGLEISNSDIDEEEMQKKEEERESFLTAQKAIPKNDREKT